VLPLTLSTASCGLFQKDHLGLQHPSANAERTGHRRGLSGKTLAGALAIGTGAAKACADVVRPQGPQIRVHRHHAGLLRRARR